MRIMSILTFDRSGENPHETPGTIERMAGFVHEMRAKGALIDTGGRDSDMLELSLTYANGRTTVTDGPFIETKEVFGGYWMVEAKSKDQLVELMQNCPAEEGDIIEIRQIFGEEDFPIKK